MRPFLCSVQGKFGFVSGLGQYLGYGKSKGNVKVVIRVMVKVE